MSTNTAPRCGWMPQYVRLQAEKGTSYSHSIAKERMRSSFDLCTPDGQVVEAVRESRQVLKVRIAVKNIADDFRGFIDPEAATFNLKSSLSQLGVKAEGATITFDRAANQAEINVSLVGLIPLGTLTLDYVGVGAQVGKIFCAEKRRSVVTLEYIERQLEQVDLKGAPLLVHGNEANPNAPWELKVVNKRVVAFLPVRSGKYTYSGDVHGFLPTVGEALKNNVNFKDLLRLHQEFREDHTRVSTSGDILMVRTFPMHMRTMFARVVEELLPPGLKCTGSDVIEPTLRDGTMQTDRTFVFYGESKEELKAVPIEFFVLEAYREHVPFSLRKTLPLRCNQVADILKAFTTIPRGAESAATFVCKGSQFDQLNSSDWVVTNPVKEPYVGNEDSVKQQQLVEKYLFQQCEYGILSAISVGDITSDGVLLTKNFPSPVLKSLLLSRQVVKRVKAIYFIRASRSHGSFFSHEDAATLRDLNTFGISIFYVEERESNMYQFILKLGQSSGMFVPMGSRLEYLQATCLGVYGSNLVAGDFEAELHQLLAGLLHFRKTCQHPLMNSNKPVALITGGGPGAMEVGNRVAKSLGILSCGMFVDFGSLSNKPGATINEQKKNPYVEAFMTYRPDKLVERQSDFNLDFPIFLTGGIGTDFEYALEEVRRKVGSVAIHPLILFGSPEHWGNKLGGRYRENLRSGTIKGSEWISNVPWIVTSGAEALKVLSAFFENRLPIGPQHPTNDRGYMVAAENL